jgi:hypothetical protein
MDTLSLNSSTRIADGHTASTEEPLNWTALHRIGFWSALATALFGFGYGLAVILMVVSNLSSGEATAGWQGIAAYQADFRPILMLPLYPSLLLAPAFAALMVCVHYYANPAKRIWSHIALVYTIIYAAMAVTNYAPQLLSVQRALLGGETDGLSMLVHGNPHAIFWSLVSCYVFMNLAMLFAAPVFSGGRLERWIRLLFLLNGFSVVLTVASLLVDNPFVFLVSSLVIWWPIFTAANTLMIVLFNRFNEKV